MISIIFNYKSINILITKTNYFNTSFIFKKFHNICIFNLEIYHSSLMIFLEVKGKKKNE